MLNLRTYQREAVDAPQKYWADGGGNPLVVMATGTGKSVVIGTLTYELLTTFPDMRMLMLVHSRELVAQNARALLNVWPQAPLGINSAGLGRRDKRSQVLFASIQSIHQEDAFSIGPRDLILVDEAHLIPKKGAGMYLSFIERMRRDVPDLRVAGFTATPFRLDSGRLDSGEGAIFNEIVYDYGIGQGIRDGYLSPLVSKATATELDVSDVRRAGGEFVAAALEAAVDKDWITRAAVAEMVAYGRERRSWLVFAAGVEHAFHLRDEIRSHGIACETVTGKTPHGERDRIIRDFKEGRLRCLTNASVLTTGFDAPMVDMVAMMRPTLSTGLYVQIVGRGTRLAPGKADCIAEGQRVLTDHGLVPIERVTTSMKVWDGASFVAHCGVILRGEREVITYAGITATPDHLVWTAEGWKTLGECAVEQTAIAVTGFGRTPVREAEGRFRRCGSTDGEEKTLSSHCLPDVRVSIVEGIHKHHSQYSGMPLVRSSAESAEVVTDARDFGQAEVYQSDRYSICKVRRQGNSVSVRQSDSNGRVGSKQSWTSSPSGDRSDQQRRTLRARKSEVLDRGTELGSHAKETFKCGDASVSPSLSRDQIRGRNPSPNDWRGHELRTNSGEVPAVLVQAKRRVWDILNAGPLHRFTVEGLLVHNCLVLDFAGNVKRHGPVDAIEARAEKTAKKEGAVSVDSVRAKTCPTCETIVALNARECPTCGHAWTVEEGPPKHDATADAETPILANAAPTWVKVRGMDLFRHAKPGAPATLRAEYLAGIAIYREWLCFDHEPGSYPRRKAEGWWKQLGGSMPAPASVEEALVRRAEVWPPEQIQVRPANKYYEVVGRKAGGRGEALEAAE